MSSGSDAISPLSTSKHAPSGTTAHSWTLVSSFEMHRKLVSALKSLISMAPSQRPIFSFSPILGLKSTATVTYPRSVFRSRIHCSHGTSFSFFAIIAARIKEAGAFFCLRRRASMTSLMMGS